jgi:hypothetical protein
MMECVLAGFLPLPVGTAAMLNGEVTLDSHQQRILQAHPEWPPEMRDAVMAGIICAGMSPDMVRVAWGHPTRMSGRNGQSQRETWHYEGRPRALERLGGQGMNEAAAREWTVSFIEGRVVGWTDWNPLPHLSP